MRNPPRRTLVLDLDETLVFSTMEPGEEIDHELQVSGQTCFVRTRPGVEAFIDKVRPLYQCRIWSTGQPAYVDAVCRALDIDWMKVWGRDRCRRLDEIPENHHEPYDKPLDRIDVDPASIVIVDNAPGVFTCNPDNGIPITTWRGDPNDQQLEVLSEYLQWLATQDDLRRDHWKWAAEVVLLRNARGHREGP